jgi:hypothetical protein
MKKKESIELLARVTDVLRSIEALGFEPNDHLIFGVETDHKGKPSAKIFKTKASPFVLMGMIDIAIRSLEQAKEEVMEKLDKVDELSRLVANLPNDLGQKIGDLEKRMRKAADDEDLEEMEKIQSELDILLQSSRGDIMDFLKNQQDKSDDSSDDKKPFDGDIDISDLMGGL